MTAIDSLRFPDHGVYAITDGPRDDLFAAVDAALAGAAAVLQYRDLTRDDARRRAEVDEISKICARYDIPFIVNDDLDLAQEFGAGLHLERDDVPVADARARLGAAAIIGVSCHGGSIDRARQAKTEGASYLAFGAMYPSPTKPQAEVMSHAILAQAADLGVPIVAIGGITPENAAALIEAGADYVAAVSAIFGATDIQTATRRFADLFDSRSAGTSR